MTMKKLLLIFVLTSNLANAQWKADRADYEILSDGNFYTTAHDMQTAITIALNTLKYNGAKMHTLNVDRKDIDSPIFNHFHRDNQEGFVYVCYVARTQTGYVIWFKFLPDEPITFEEDYAILEYEGKN
jgi:hypothetical protein